MLEAIQLFASIPAFWFIVIAVLGACTVVAIFEPREEDTR